ncbi:MAG: FAD-dependent oxidoreductase, partial [Clostridiales bacterium]|nr:FAD-dependent oxidoreductase [Clostridiales bacterium]
MRKAKHMSYELVVAGGGLAGLCCALAAARKGVKTALVQDRP